MFERFALLLRNLLRPFAQLTEERVEQRRVVITEVSRSLGKRKRVEPDQMGREALGKRRGEGDAPAGRRLGIEDDQQVLVAHGSIS
jgi:hypothetical protein